MYYIREYLHGILNNLANKHKYAPELLYVTFYNNFQKKKKLIKCVRVEFESFSTKYSYTTTQSLKDLRMKFNTYHQQRYIALKMALRSLGDSMTLFVFFT